MSTFITHGNRLIDFANPQNSDIHIDDIIQFWITAFTPQ